MSFGRIGGRSFAGGAVLLLLSSLPVLVRGQPAPASEKGAIPEDAESVPGSGDPPGPRRGLPAGTPSLLDVDAPEAPDATEGDALDEASDPVSSPRAREVVVRAGGVRITVAEVEARLAHRTEGEFEGLRGRALVRAVALELLRGALLARRAERLGLASHPAVRRVERRALASALEARALDDAAPRPSMQEDPEAAAAAWKERTEAREALLRRLRERYLRLVAPERVERVPIELPARRVREGASAGRPLARGAERLPIQVEEAELVEEGGHDE